MAARKRWRVRFYGQPKPGIDGLVSPNQTLELTNHELDIVRQVIRGIGLPNPWYGYSTPDQRHDWVALVNECLVAVQRIENTP